MANKVLTFCFGFIDLGWQSETRKSVYFRLVVKVMRL